MSGPLVATGPLVQFIVVAKRWVVRVGETRPLVGQQWVVDGEMCRVLSVQVLGRDRWRAYVERDLGFDASVPQYCMKDLGRE
ncbi:hypothetical protein EON82_22305 [bacterium]|nr:MAG: hypothetical protein EON82_22305 [bacterium]